MDDDQEYLLTLQGIFNSCSTSGSQELNLRELEVLCEKLELKDQSEALIQTLLETQTKVDFETFKDGFLSILSETIDSSEDDADVGHVADTPGTSPKRISPQISPKFVRGDKKYGRRSRPETDTEGDMTDMSDTDHSFSQSPRHTPLSFKNQLSLRLASLEDEMEEALTQEEAAEKAKSSSPKRVSPKRVSPKTSPKHRSPPSSSSRSPNSGRTRSKHGTKTAETFEAEGQMDQSITDMADERHHMALIWQELGVGAEGFLTIEELASVCERIGMDEMNSEELQHLFDKLDVDSDSRVSFDEFLQGLFQYGGPATTSTTPSRQVTTPRQKLRMSVASQLDESRQTPSLVISAGSGLFSALDTDNTGYVKADTIIELWDSFGVPQGAEILEYLQFNLSAKISLVDLTYALEQELHGMEEDNATYQAAIATYEHELRHLKGSTDNLAAERDKFRGDLAEANARIALLVKEGDDRYSALERSKERELNSMERKYEEQIKLLQAEIDHERQSIQHQSSKQRHKLETELDNLRDEETKLREKLSHTTKDFERLEIDILDMASKCTDLEQQNLRQQRDLEATAELHRKLEEIESSRDIILDEQQRFSAQKLHELQAENKDLKDKADEMTIELEELHQQVSIHRKQKQRGLSGERQRAGSTLADYSHSLRRGHDSEASDEASEVESPRMRRRKPRESSDEPVSLHTVKLQDEVQQLKVQHESLQAQHSQDLTATRAERDKTIQQLRSEHSDSLIAIKTEHGKKLQELTSQHLEDLRTQKSMDDDRLKSHREESEEKQKKLRMEYEAEIKGILSENEKKLGELKDKHFREVQDLEEKHSVAMQSLEANLDDVSAETAVRNQELQALNRGFSIERKDIEDAFKMEIAEMEDQHMQEKNSIIQEHKKEKEEMETTFVKMMEEALAEKEAKSIDDLEQDRENWAIKAESEKNLLRHEHDQEMDRLIAQHVEALSKQERELSKEMDRRKTADQSQQEEDLHRQSKEAELQLEQQRRVMEQEFLQDKEAMIEQHDHDKAALIEQHEAKIKEYDNKFAQGVDGLDGQLKEDFYKLLEQHWKTTEAEVQAALRAEQDKVQEEAVQQRADLAALQQLDRKNLENEIAEEKRKLNRDLEQQKADLAEQVEREKTELMNQINREKATLQQDADEQRKDLVKEFDRKTEARKAEHLREKEELIVEHEAEMQALKRDHDLERTSLDLEREIIRREVKDELQQSAEVKLENEFLHQVGLLKHTFQEEREQLEDRIRSLEQNLSDAANQDTLAAEQHNKEAEQKLRLAKEVESRSKKQIEDLNRTISKLRDERQRLEDDKKNLRKELEDKIHRLMIEKEEAVSASHSRVLQAAQSPNNDLDRDLILREIEAQKQLLMDKTGTLQRQLEGLEQNNMNRSTPLQMSHDRLIDEKRGLEANLHDMDDKVKGLLDQSLAAEQYKAQAINRETERDALRRQLEMTSDRLTDASTALSLANSEHQREVAALRQKLNDSVDADKFNKLNSEYLESQKKLGELEAALEKRTAEMTKALMGTQADHQKSVQRLESEKEEAEQKAAQSQHLLDDHVSQLKNRLEESSKRDLLVKDLYVENAQLIKSLQITEKKEKDAERNAYSLEEKCRCYQRLIHRLTPLAMS